MPITTNDGGATRRAVPRPRRLSGAARRGTPVGGGTPTREPLGRLASTCPFGHARLRPKHRTRISSLGLTLFRGARTVAEPTTAAEPNEGTPSPNRQRRRHGGTRNAKRERRRPPVPRLDGHGIRQNESDVRPSGYRSHEPTRAALAKPAPRPPGRGHPKEDGRAAMRDASVRPRYRPRYRRRRSRPPPASVPPDRHPSNGSPWGQRSEWLPAHSSPAAVRARHRRPKPPPSA